MVCKQIPFGRITGLFGVGVSLGCQQVDDACADITLYDNGSVLCRAACSDFRLELLAQRPQVFLPTGETGYERDGLALPACPFNPDTKPLLLR